MTLEIPDDALKVLGDNAAGQLRLAAAMKLYEMGRLSSGAAAALAGLERVAFLDKLSEYGVSPFQITPDDLERDLATARRVARGDV